MTVGLAGAGLVPGVQFGPCRRILQALPSRQDLSLEPIVAVMSSVHEMQVQALMTNAERYSLSAAVFTALTDVEIEIDGLLSFDRAVIKMGAQALHRIHTQLIEASKDLNSGPTGQHHDSCLATFMIRYMWFAGSSFSVKGRQVDIGRRWRKSFVNA